MVRVFDAQSEWTGSRGRSWVFAQPSGQGEVVVLVVDAQRKLAEAPPVGGRMPPADSG